MDNGDEMQSHTTHRALCVVGASDPTNDATTRSGWRATMGGAVPGGSRHATRWDERGMYRTPVKMSKIRLRGVPLDFPEGAFLLVGTQAYNPTSWGTIKIRLSHYTSTTVRPPLAVANFSPGRIVAPQQFPSFGAAHWWRLPGPSSRPRWLLGGSCAARLGRCGGERRNGRGHGHRRGTHRRDAAPPGAPLAHDDRRARELQRLAYESPGMSRRDLQVRDDGSRPPRDRQASRSRSRGTSPSINDELQSSGRAGARTAAQAATAAAPRPTNDDLAHAASVARELRYAKLVPRTLSTDETRNLAMWLAIDTFACVADVCDAFRVDRSHAKRGRKTWLERRLPACMCRCSMQVGASVQLQGGVRSDTADTGRGWQDAAGARANLMTSERARRRAARHLAFGGLSTYMCE